MNKKPITFQAVKFAIAKQEQEILDQIIKDDPGSEYKTDEKWITTILDAKDMYALVTILEDVSEDDMCAAMRIMKIVLPDAFTD